MRIEQPLSEWKKDAWLLAMHLCMHPLWKIKRQHFGQSLSFTSVLMTWSGHYLVAEETNARKLGLALIQSTLKHYLMR